MSAKRTIRRVYETQTMLCCNFISHRSESMQHFHFVYIWVGLMLATFRCLSPSLRAEALHLGTAERGVTPSGGSCLERTVVKAAKAPVFTLKDQFKKEHRYHFP